MKSYLFRFKSVFVWDEETFLTDLYGQGIIRVRKLADLILHSYLKLDDAMKFYKHYFVTLLILSFILHLLHLLCSRSFFFSF